MKTNRIFTKSFSSIVLSTLLLGCSALAQAGTCVLEEKTPGAPPMSWDDSDYVSETRYSSANLAACNIPTGSTIISVTGWFDAHAKESVLTNGLLYGDYVLTVSGGGVSQEVTATVSAQGAVQISSTALLPLFNGLSLDGLQLSLTGQLRNSVNLRCRDTNPAVCEDYMYFNHGISIEYDDPTAPVAPSWVNASISNGNDITISWASVADAAYYEREVRLNGGSWINRHSYTTTSVTFYNQQERTYEYRVRACSSGNLCSPWTVSAPVTVSLTPATPSAPTASVSNGNTITINWNAVANASYYIREVSIDYGLWINPRTFTGTQAIYYNQKVRSYRYRVKACNSSDKCSAFSAASNSVTVY